MSLMFSAPVQRLTRSGQPCVRTYVVLDLWNPTRRAFGGTDYLFRWDTGADFTTLSRATADRIGLPRVPGRRVGLRTGMGTQPVLTEFVELRYRFPALPGWTFTTTAAVVPTGTDNGPRPLFGHRDIFDHFLITTPPDRDAIYFVLRDPDRSRPGRTRE